VRDLIYKYDVEVQQWDGTAPLFQACWSRHVDSAPALEVTAGANINGPVNGGATPLPHGLLRGASWFGASTRLLSRML